MQTQTCANSFSLSLFLSLSFSLSLSRLNQIEQRTFSIRGPRQNACPMRTAFNIMSRTTKEKVRKRHGMFTACLNGGQALAEVKRKQTSHDLPNSKNRPKLRPHASDNCEHDCVDSITFAILRSVPTSMNPGINTLQPASWSTVPAFSQSARAKPTL